MSLPPDCRSARSSSGVTASVTPAPAVISRNLRRLIMRISARGSQKRCDGTDVARVVLLPLQRDLLAALFQNDPGRPGSRSHADELELEDRPFRVHEAGECARDERDLRTGARLHE